MNLLEQSSLWIAAACDIVVTLGTSLHALLRKRDVRSTIGWVGLIWLVPVVGPILYLILGVNRIHRAATLGRSSLRTRRHPSMVEPVVPDDVAAQANKPHLAALARLTSVIADRPMLPGNRIIALHNGDEAYPEMLAAINGAKRSVSLSTYIFDVDEAGRVFVDALADAAGRGVEVRVLVDAAGARYGRPGIHKILKKRGVRAARFMAAGRVRSLVYLNLRLHRKILVVDGEIGFTGGMNIRQDHLLGSKPKFEVLDWHFRLEGPVVTQLQDVFAEDWEFTTREELEGDLWFPRLPPVGDVAARGIGDGPDEDLDKMRWVIGGAIACAKERVQVVTPYFLPDDAIINALNIAAMRGIEVDVLIPHRSNIPLVEWATVAQLPYVLGHGVRVHRSAPPFEHTKLMIVDSAWVFFGSGNWDARSLRLNFELNVECYDPMLAGALEQYVRERIATGSPMDLESIAAIPLPSQIRNGVARLLVPYL